MGKYTIEYSEDSKQDLFEIKRYIKYNLQEPNIAKKLTDKILKEIRKLSDNPEMYSIIDDELINKLKIRRIIVDNYVVFYRVKDNSVEIVRIMYEKRNWMKLL